MGVGRLSVEMHYGDCQLEDEMKYKSKCHGANVFFRQINGAGKALPHCLKCHKPCEVEKEREKKGG